MTDLVVCRFGVAIRNSPFAIRNMNDIVWKKVNALIAYLNEYNKRNKLDQ